MVSPRRKRTSAGSCGSKAGAFRVRHVRWCKFGSQRDPEGRDGAHEMKFPTVPPTVIVGLYPFRHGQRQAGLANCVMPARLRSCLSRLPKDKQIQP
jgi:hypothetical protein